MSCEHEVRFTIKPTDDACRFHFDVRAYKDRIVAPDEYSGVTVVTPSSETQVLETKDRLVRDDITVEGITGTQTITENGTYDVVDKATVIVNNPAQWTSKGLAEGTEPYGDIDLGDATRIIELAFQGRTGITGITGKHVTSPSNNMFRNCTGLKEVHLPRISTATQSGFGGCTSIKLLYLPSVNGVNTYAFSGCTALETLIFLRCGNLGRYVTEATANDKNLKTIVLGGVGGITRTSVNFFRASPYAEGGSGGDIYIPKQHYEHLGDGSNLDYLSYAEWNTLNGYGTITWKQIEGSEYETYMPGGEKYEEEMALT